MRLILSDKDVRILDHSPAPVEQILLEQGINPLDVIVFRNGKLLPEDTIIQGSDEVRIIRIAHGG
jgi:sulfur carrier protein ThiS